MYNKHGEAVQTNSGSESHFLSSQNTLYLQNSNNQGGSLSNTNN